MMALRELFQDFGVAGISEGSEWVVMVVMVVVGVWWSIHIDFMSTVDSRDYAQRAQRSAVYLPRYQNEMTPISLSPPLILPMNSALNAHDTRKRQ